MHLATYEFEGKEKIGLLTKNKEKIIPIEELIKENPPSSMLELIETFSQEMSIKLNNAEQDCNTIKLTQVKIMAPIPNTLRGVICLGKNYQGHIKELAQAIDQDAEIPEYPIYFYKMVDKAVGDQGYIPSHNELTSKLDYEVELAVVIGKKGQNIPEERVEEYIFGYTIINDITARNLQKQHKQWFRGKSLDGTCPMGPYLIHKSALNFPPELNIKSYVNDELRQNDNTRNMLHSISYVISEISEGITLRPGDIISTGTPEGVGLGFKPSKFLKHGDKIKCYIEKIGTLTNTVK